MAFFMQNVGPNVTKFDASIDDTVQESNIAMTQKQYGSGITVNPSHPDDKERTRVLEKIENCVLDILESLSKGESPVLRYRNRNTWQNISFNSDIGLEMNTIKTTYTSLKFDDAQSTRTFGLVLKVLNIMYKLVQEDKFSTKRDIYYQDPELFRSQSVLDNVVDNISCMLEIHRWDLHVLATSKGCVAGDLKIQDMHDNYVDCRNSKNGVLVPMHVNLIKCTYTEAKFLLIVEKDATFQKLLDDGFCEKLCPCILITGKGFPDVNTRMLVRRLWNDFHLTVLVLVDADPYGMEIMSVYKYGSRSHAFETDCLAVPALRWLGVLPSDISRLGIPESTLIPLTKADQNKAMDLLKRPFVKENLAWQQEIQLLLKQGKAEIQCLDTISPNFLTDVYLPGKIKNEGWI